MGWGLAGVGTRLSLLSDRKLWFVLLWNVKSLQANAAKKRKHVKGKCFLGTKHFCPLFSWLAKEKHSIDGTAAWIFLNPADKCLELWYFCHFFYMLQENHTAQTLHKRHHFLLKFFLTKKSTMCPGPLGMSYRMTSGWACMRSALLGGVGGSSQGKTWGWTPEMLQGWPPLIF